MDRTKEGERGNAARRKGDKEALLTFIPHKEQMALALLSAALLILSFPNFDFSFLAWIALTPLLLAIAQKPKVRTSFILGWLTGALFFYATCYWLTYAMIRYGGIQTVISYLLLVPGALILGLFPALFSAALALFLKRWGMAAMWAAPLIWPATEWLRLITTGQLWNALGYSQSFSPNLIQGAQWGGVYMVSFTVLTVNAGFCFAIINPALRNLLISVAAIALVLLAFTLLPAITSGTLEVEPGTETLVVAIQPNVPMEDLRSEQEYYKLVQRHVSLSSSVLEKVDAGETIQIDANLSRDLGNSKDLRELPRVVIWPESPMAFSYGRDEQFREFASQFARAHRTSLIFNSLEPAPADGFYNSAVIVDEGGLLAGQYDKVRLMPFGEYVPIPGWVPGVSMVPALVGNFTPGSKYPVVPLGAARTGIFICFESAFPSIARQFSRQGSDVLLNISNDGYLGPTAVIRQHLANAIFRAIESRRPVLRVTNTGITAYISEYGNVINPTETFRVEVRTWIVNRVNQRQTFYTKAGDLFVMACAGIGVLLLVFALKKEILSTKGYNDGAIIERSSS